MPKYSIDAGKGRTLTFEASFEQLARLKILKDLIEQGIDVENNSIEINRLMDEIPDEVIPTVGTKEPSGG